MKQFAIVGLVLACCVMGFCNLASADDSRPLYVEVTEFDAGAASASHYNYRLQWRIPPTVPVYNAPTVVLPDICEGANSDSSAPAGGSASFDAVQHRLYRCSESLSGQVVSIEYPGANPAVSTLIKFKAGNGEQHTRMLSPQEFSWRVPEAETKFQVAKDYMRLGVHHIWVGIDHLLFVVCLLWIAGSLRRVLITITGFTLAHSVTLALSALKVVQVPVPPVEAVIALSIVFLATEIARGPRDSITWRYPIAVSSSFGLLHGFGFAAALSEIGLPQTELVTGLLFFNLGVEIGQALFAVAAMLLISLLKRLVAFEGAHSHWNERLRVLISYGVGGLASFWMIERLA